MRVVLDTNVFISGIFFRGAPSKILEAWRDGRVLPVLSVDILVEYDRVGRDLALRYPGVDPAPLKVDRNETEVQEMSLVFGSKGFKPTPSGLYWLGGSCDGTRDQDIIHIADSSRSDGM